MSTQRGSEPSRYVLPNPDSLASCRQAVTKAAPDTGDAADRRRWPRKTVKAMTLRRQLKHQAWGRHGAANQRTLTVPSGQSERQLNSRIGCDQLNGSCMACKRSGVQIPSAPPQVNGPIRLRPPSIRRTRAADWQQTMNETCPHCLREVRFDILAQTQHGRLLHQIQKCQACGEIVYRQVDREEPGHTPRAVAAQGYPAGPSRRSGTDRGGLA
jgi:hypothetical protein